MSLRGRVAWTEGTLLLPQHFQQQERFLEETLEARVEPLRPYPWGLVELKLDVDLHRQGKFGVESAAGVLPDGTPFHFPAHGRAPPLLELSPNIDRAIIYISLPHRQPGVVEFGSPGPTGATNAGARYLLEAVRPVDTFGGHEADEPIEIGRLALTHDVGDRANARIRLAVARVIELRDGVAILDQDFIPPVLDVQANGRLSGWLDAITEAAKRRIDELADRAPDGASGRSNGPLLTLQLLNRWHVLLQHLRGRARVHPEEFFGVLLQFAGELATHTTRQRRLIDPPTYRHDDLKGSFEPLVTRLMSMLAFVFNDRARMLDIEVLEPERAYVAPIADRSVFDRDRIVLAAFAPHRTAQVRQDFASLAKLAAVEKIATMRDRAVFAIPLRPLDGAPDGVRLQEDYVYFELQRGQEWDDLSGSAGLGIYIPGQWPGLKLELWAIRES